MEFRLLVEGILQNDDGGILILQRSDHESYAGQWQPPAGGIEPGETDYEALRREFYEETGLAVDPVTTIDSVQSYIVDPAQTASGEPRYSIITPYRVAGDGYGLDDVALSDEHQDCAWLYPDDVAADEYELVGSFQETIEQIWDDQHATAALRADD